MNYSVVMDTIHYQFKTLTSTNAWAKQNIHLFEKHKLTLITADTQTQGRGQYGRQWISPPGQNLYASFCFYIDQKQQDPLSITHVLAISVIAILEQYGIRGEIKWPNDVKVNGKKIAGILCETVYNQEEFGVVVGLGFNINMPNDLLKNVDQPATSILSETGQMQDKLQIIEQLKVVFSNNLQLFIKEGFQSFLPILKKLLIPGNTPPNLKNLL